MSAPAPSVLAGILQSTRVELERRKRALAPAQLESQVADIGAGAGPRGPRLRESLREPGIGVIAEFKRRSPSAGVLRAEADAADIAAAYQRGGAAAISVLTEGPHFEGSLEDLRDAAAACELPILRKDFILDAYQLHEARLAGADAVLLIVAALASPELAALRAEASAIGLESLIEVHDRPELEIALDAGADLLGINNRDLRDFSVDVTRTSALIDAVPSGVTVVSESGIGSAQQLSELERQGVHAVLVGESLMRAPDPERALLDLRGIPRDGRASAGSHADAI